jgi:nitrous oxidase accessory protein
MKYLLTILLLFVLGGISFAKTIIVGKGQSITSLKQAIAIAKNGDTILVQKAIYKEGSITLSKSITLIGQNYPVLDGEGKYEILVISGKNSTVKGLEFRNSGRSGINDMASIKLTDASHVLIEDNKIVHSFFAIHVSASAHCTIRNNEITGSPKSEQLTGNGIHLWKSDHALITGNRITGHRDGIYLEFVTESLIQNNTSEENIRYGLHFMFSHNDRYVSNVFRNNGAGVAVMYSNKVIMEKNYFEENWGASAYGLLLKEIKDGSVSNNTFYKNTAGIYMEGSSRMEIQKNIFKNNGWAVKVMASCDENSFHHNNFFGNSFDIATNGTMVLNTFYNNYWDKYEGYDINKDGKGDVPYHPVSMYAMLVEQNPNTLILMRSFMVSLLDKAEKAIPSLTPENLADNTPMIKPNRL